MPASIRPSRSAPSSSTRCERRGERGRVADRRRASHAVATDLGDRPDVARDDRRAGQLGLEDREPEPLVERRVGEHRGPPQQPVLRRRRRLGPSRSTRSARGGRSAAIAPVDARRMRRRALRRARASRRRRPRRPRRTRRRAGRGPCVAPRCRSRARTAGRRARRPRRVAAVGRRREGRRRPEVDRSRPGRCRAAPAPRSPSRRTTGVHPRAVRDRPPQPPPGSSDHRRRQVGVAEEPAVVDRHDRRQRRRRHHVVGAVDERRRRAPTDRSAGGACATTRARRRARARRGGGAPAAGRTGSSRGTGRARRRSRRRAPRPCRPWRPRSRCGARTAGRRRSRLATVDGASGMSADTVAAHRVGGANQVRPVDSPGPPTRPSSRADVRPTATFDQGSLPVPRAFITGITGQDGQHLAEFLHDKGYDVFGMVKGQSNPRIADRARGDAVRRDGARRPRRPAVAGGGARALPARRGVQPRRDQLRRAELQPGRADGQHHRARRAAHARGDPHGRRRARTTRSASTRRRRRRCSARCARRRRPR